jgi:hypothetical protein
MHQFLSRIVRSLISGSTSRPSPRSSRVRNLSIELLESRTLLTANVPFASDVSDVGQAHELRSHTANVSKAPTGSAITIAPATTVEGDSGTHAMNFTVTLSNVSESDVTIRYRTAKNGSAKAGDDYTRAKGTVVIPAGQTSATISVSVIGDSTVEPDETFALKLSRPKNVKLTTKSAIGTITDDDSGGETTRTVSISSASITEGDSGTKSLAFTVTLSTSSTSNVTVAYNTTNGTAIAGSDFTLTSGRLTIAAGQTTGTINVPIKGDTTVEPDETFTVTLLTPTSATLGDATATGTITDDDAAIVPTVSIAPAIINEGDLGTKSLNFLVSLSSPSTSDVSVAYTTSDLSATQGSDYTVTSGTLTIPAGQTTGTLSVPVLGDDVVEPDETFNVTLSNPVHATLQTTVASGTILNDDSAVFPTVSIASASALEGDFGTSSLVFTVTLSSVSTTDVSVSYSTLDGTATSFSDYNPTTGTLVIPAGQTTGTISVPINGDADPEADETFSLSLSNPLNATIGTATATGTITNDDLS